MRHLLSLYLFLLLGFSSYSQDVRAKLVNTAYKYVGIREKTGNNDGKEVEAILARVGLKKGNPWCAALQYSIHSDNALKVPKSGYSPDWFKTNVVYDKKKMSVTKFKAKNGQVFGLYIPSKGRIGHVGMIVGEYGNFYVTVEGNTNDAGSDEGEGCYKKLRMKSSISKISDYCITIKN